MAAVAAAVIVGNGVFAVLGHCRPHLFETRADARPLDRIQVWHPQPEFQLICRHFEIADHQIVVRHVVVRIGDIAGVIGGFPINRVCSGVGSTTLNRSSKIRCARLL